MNAQPVAKMGSLYDLDPGKPWWMVQHNDNSDHGRVQHYFESEGDALAYAKEIEAHPPAGNWSHPAPATLDVRVFAVERLR